MATTSAVPPQETAPLSEVQRVVNTFFAPSKTFTDLRRSASWWLPFLITAIVSVAFVYVVRSESRLPQGGGKPDTNPAEAGRPHGAPAGRSARTSHAAANGILEGVLVRNSSGWTDFLRHHRSRAVRHVQVCGERRFSIQDHVRAGDLRLVASDVRVTASDYFASCRGQQRWILDSESCRNQSGNHCGSDFLPVRCIALLSSVDVFTIWSLFLMAIGVTCISKVKRGTAFAVVFGWFGLWVLIKLGLAAASS